MPLNKLVMQFQERVKENLLLWGTILSLLLISIYLETLTLPAKRPFSLTDIDISYPFIEQEKYPDSTLFLFCILGPFVLMSILTLFDKINGKFHRFYKTTSCFSFAVALTSFVTTFLKKRLAKLRPDFLARCKPNVDISKAKDLMYSENICSAPYGEFLLNDGYKSCPSGHSSMSMCGMVFLSLWLYVTYGKRSKNGLISVMCFTPLLLAVDVATSRIYDFKHGYFDILFGSFIGIACTIVSIIYIEFDLKDEPDNILPI